MEPIEYTVGESMLKLKPMPLWQSLIAFGMPALVAVVCHYFIWPYFINVGLSNEDGYHYANIILFIGLIVAAVIAYWKEGNPLRWRSFRERYRLKGMGRREWKWTTTSIFANLLLALITTFLAVAVYEFLEFVPPEISPSGQPTNISLLLVVLLLNIFGEELWWRGYILPRQELRHGKYTWLLHGILWACFHIYKWWAVPFMLVTTPIVPFIAQRLKNTTPSVIIHLIVNGSGIAMTLLFSQFPM